VGMLETDFTNAPKPKKSKWDWGTSARIYNLKMYLHDCQKYFYSCSMMRRKNRCEERYYINMVFFSMGPRPLVLSSRQGLGGRFFHTAALSWGRPFLAYLFLWVPTQVIRPPPPFVFFFQIKNVIFFSFGLNFCRKFQRNRNIQFLVFINFLLNVLLHR
jgi:hypothetical protein